VEQFPSTVQQFQDWFQSEKACMEYIIRLRWPEGFRCPNCNAQKAWFTKRKEFHCVECGRQTSPIAGTIFQDTHKPLRLWFQAIWYLVSQKNGVSALGIQKVLDLGSYRTAWSWLHKIRIAMIRPGRERLSGIVEVDETLIGGPKPGKRGRGAAGKVLVLVAVEDRGSKGIGRIRLRIITDASGATLKVAIAEMVEIGSTIRTDGWTGYNMVKASGYQHVVIAHTEEEIGLDPSPLVHLVASLVKRWLLGTHQGGTQSTHLNYYLDEFTFRFNRRKSRSRGKLFYRLMQQALEIKPVTCENLKAKSHFRTPKM
jgi:transposase-like protein/Zn ribbon nucleic-acid-binding protein